VTSMNVRRSSKVSTPQGMLLSAVPLQTPNPLERLKLFFSNGEVDRTAIFGNLQGILHQFATHHRFPRDDDRAEHAEALTIVAGRAPHTAQKNGSGGSCAIAATSSGLQACSDYAVGTAGGLQTRSSSRENKPS